MFHAVVNAAYVLIIKNTRGLNSLKPLHPPPKHSGIFTLWRRLQHLEGRFRCPIKCIYTINQYSIQIANGFKHVRLPILLPICLPLYTPVPLYIATKCGQTAISFVKLSIKKNRRQWRKGLEQACFSRHGFGEACYQTLSTIHNSQEKCVHTLSIPSRKIVTKVFCTLRSLTTPFYEKNIENFIVRHKNRERGKDWLFGIKNLIQNTKTVRTERIILFVMTVQNHFLHRSKIACPSVYIVSCVQPKTSDFLDILMRLCYQKWFGSDHFFVYFPFNILFWKRVTLTTVLSKVVESNGEQW